MRSQYLEVHAMGPNKPSASTQRRSFQGRKYLKPANVRDRLVCGGP